MNTIIPDIETLKTVVKINAAIPYESIECFMEDAQEIYILPQIGNKTFEKSSEDGILKNKILRALGPLTLMLATPELGISYGDNGITVDNQQGKRSPANEAKIEAAKENLLFRGMQALDRLLKHLSDNSELYPDYIEYQKKITGNSPCIISNAQAFQDGGMVNIDYSTVTFRTMLPTLRQLQERQLREMLPEELFTRLLANNELSAKENVLLSHCVRYLANKCAELYTSQTGHDQRTATGTPEFKPVIRPVYQDTTETGNFFAGQANYYTGKIQTYLTEIAVDLCITIPDAAMNFNSKEKHLFTSIS